MLTFRFDGACGIMTVPETITSGMVGQKVRLEFSDEWETLKKTAVFIAGDVIRDVVDAAAVVTIPSEVLVKSMERLYVGVYGVSADGTVVIPTIRARGPFIVPGADPSGDESVDPDLPVWAQLQAQIDTLKENAGGSSDFQNKWNLICPEDYGAVGDGVKDDSDAIQAAIDAAGTDAIVYMRRKTYRIATGLSISHSNRRFRCEGTISYTGTGAALTIGSKNIVAEIDAIQAPNGTAVKVAGSNKYIEHCQITVGRIDSSKIGLHIYTDTVSITYNQFRIGYLCASETGIFVECMASFINENWYHLGKITGCQMGIKLYSAPELESNAGLGTNDNHFFSGGFEGISTDGCAIFIQNSSGNKFDHLRCAEYYGKNMVVIKGYSKGNDIKLSRIYLTRVDVSEHTGGSNTIFRSAVVSDELNGFYLGTEARLDEDCGLTYDSRFAKASQEVARNTFPENIICPVNTMILNSLYFLDESINGLTYSLGHVYSHTSSMARGNPVTLTFGDTGGRIVLLDMNGDTILDNSNGDFAGRTVAVKWDGVEKAGGKNIWTITGSGKAVFMEIESYVNEAILGGAW